MKELTVSLHYNTATSPPDAQSSDVALPLRVLDADGGLVVEGAASRSTPAQLDVGAAGEPLFVRLTWPSGKTETKRVEGPQLVFDDASISRNEWAAWAVPRLKTSSLAAEALISEKAGIDRFDRAWLRLWQFKEQKWSAATFAPTQRYRNEAAVQLDFILDQSGWCLQLGGASVPWIIISLPPGGRCRVLITPNGSNDPRKEPLKVVVTGFRSDAETLLEFLSRDSLRAAHSVANYAPLATKMLEGKFEDPVAAVAGAYFLLRTGGWRQVPGWWFENLDLQFPWIADGSIIRCAVLTRGGLPDSDSTERALSRLAESLKRGVPIFAEGLSLLHEAASALRPEGKSECASVFEMIDRLAASCLWAGAAFAFSGDAPGSPNPKRRRGMPKQRRTTRKAADSPSTSEAENPTIVFLQNIG
jgi:hypothetical protein